MIYIFKHRKKSSSLCNFFDDLAVWNVFAKSQANHISPLENFTWFGIYIIIILYEFIYIPLNEICEQITSKRFGTSYYRPVTGYKQSIATTG